MRFAQYISKYLPKGQGRFDWSLHAACCVSFKLLGWRKGGGGGDVQKRVGARRQAGPLYVENLSRFSGPGAGQHEAQGGMIVSIIFNSPIYYAQGTKRPVAADLYAFFGHLIQCSGMETELVDYEGPGRHVIGGTRA